VSALLFVPIALPLACAGLGMVLRAPWAGWRLAAAAGLGVLGTGVALVYWVWVHGTVALQVGAWPAPFGITLVADVLSAVMVVVAGGIHLVVVAYSGPSLDPARKAQGYYPLLCVLLMGVCGAFLTGDLFNLFVWFEVMLIASFVLLSLGGERAQLEGAVKYVALNLGASALFLAAVGLLYGVAGTLNLADLSLRLKEVARPGLVTTIALLLLAAFGIKAAAFPLFFWLPAAYHTPPLVVSALFAALLTKVGVYALYRTFSLLFVQEVGFTHELILWMAALTMLTGVLGAAAQMDIRRILSFHIISQIGYMLMGLGLFSAAAVGGGVFYVVHHIVVKTNLFLIAGLLARTQGSYDLRELGGQWARRPWLAVVFLIPALALAGLPPLSGFFAKLSLVRAGLEQGRYVVVAVAAVVSLLTLYSMTKIWTEAFWKDPPHAPAEGARLPLAMVVPTVALAALTVALGVGAELGSVVGARVAGELLSVEGYVSAVLGARR
jgi:multicomponent Na+:H+ antiporter subunit D